MNVKKTAFAGSWYPGSADRCRSAIERFNDDLKVEADTKTLDNPVAGVVPHAGWVYSGKLACRVFAALAHGRRAVDTIVLFGVHMHADSPAFVLDCTAVDTPLGAIEIDKALIDRLVKQADAASVNLKQLTTHPIPRRKYPGTAISFYKIFFPKSPDCGVRRAALGCGAASIGNSRSCGCKRARPLPDGGGFHRHDPLRPAIRI